VARSRVEVEAALADPAGVGVANWLLKRALGAAGRGQRRVTARLSDADLRFIAASLAADGGLQVEPLVALELEMSILGFLSSQGRLRVGQPCIFGVVAQRHYRDARRAGRDELQASE